MDASYEGPVLPEDLEVHGETFIKELLQVFKQGKLLHRKYVIQILLAMKDMLSKLPSLLRISIGDLDGAHITVCGDTHGQFYDVCHIFEINGLPSNENPYIFNGGNCVDKIVR